MRGNWVTEVSPVTGKHIDAILPFLEQFEEAGVMPWFNYDEAVVEFQQSSLRQRLGDTEGPLGRMAGCG